MVQLLEPYANSHCTQGTGDTGGQQWQTDEFSTIPYAYKTDRDTAHDYCEDGTSAENIVGPMSPHYTQPILTFGPLGTLFYNDTVNRSVRSVLLSDNREDFDAEDAVEGIHVVDKHYSLHYSSSQVAGVFKSTFPKNTNANAKGNACHQVLHHPSVDFDTVLHILRSEHILITELISGVNLTSVLKTFLRSLPAPSLHHTKLDRIYSNLDATLRRIAWDMMLLLRNLHRYRITHRDIKGENIMSTHVSYPKHGELVLIDFGFSETREMMTTSLGTSAYKAPELETNQAYDSRVDVYSAGKIFDLL
uniref:Myosin-IIIb n=1 Tax=Lygus hesperus TaxID=30085 RepID=A0A0A9XVF2_LYGHE